jgi:Domain of unknown function (DUF4149)
MIEIFTLLLSALLFGGMTLYSFGFAPLLFTSLPVDQAGALLRKAFPHYYLFVFVTSAASAASFFLRDPWSAGLMLSVALFAMLARQGLLPLINAARDADRKKRLTGYTPRRWSSICFNWSPSLLSWFESLSGLRFTKLFSDDKEELPPRHCIT